MRNEFREFTRYDWMGYAGCEKLLNNTSPRICDQSDGYLFDDYVAVIISGNEAEKSTIISVITESGEYMLELPGFNRSHLVIADAIVDDLKEYEVLEESIESVVSDYDLTKI